MEAFIGGLFGALAVISYMFFRINRVLFKESMGYKKDARKAQGKVEKLEQALEMQTNINSSSKVTRFPDQLDARHQAKYAQLKGQYDLLENEHKLTLEALAKIQSEVERPEYISSSLAVKIKTYLASAVRIGA